MILAVFIGVLGLLCLYFEFFLPGGVLALLGGVILIASCIFFFFQSDSSLATFLYFVGLILASTLVCLFAIRSIRRSGKENSFFLQKDQAGFTAGSLEEDLVGKEGVVSTELKPAGHVRIDGKVYQAVSQGEFLLKGSFVEVCSVKGSHLVVKVIKK